MKEGGLLHRFSLRLAPLLLAWLIRLWFGTCRIREHGVEHKRCTLDAGKAIVASFWHYTLLVIFYHLRRESGVVMVSASRDGEYIARLAEELGFDTARGSRNNRGMQALKEILKAAKAGRNTAIVADGSQGPPRIAQPGAILVASRTGVPVLPMMWSATRYLTIPSWDRTAIPKPFSRIDYFFGEPLSVPPDLKEEGIEEYRLILEERLNELYSRAWQLHGQDEH
jgi:lysophospholipid acyltransferase (LPLAT)-like uncharacterized protein